MELNREEIIKALEICTGTEQDYYCTNIPCPYGDVGSCEQLLMAHAFALIKEQEQKIFELENRLKECENGYEGTLFLDRCKLHDAEQKIKELNAEYDSMAKSVNEASDLIRKLRADKKELTEENEKIGIENFDLVCELSRIKEDTVRKMQKRLKAELNNCCRYISGNREYFIVGEELIDRIAKEMLKEIQDA